MSHNNNSFKLSLSGGCTQSSPRPTTHYWLARFDQDMSILDRPYRAHLTSPPRQILGSPYNITRSILFPFGNGGAVPTAPACAIYYPYMPSTIRGHLLLCLSCLSWLLFNLFYLFCPALSCSVLFCLICPILPALSRSVYSVPSYPGLS